MSKTKETLEFEERLRKHTSPYGYPYGAFEVTLINKDCGSRTTYERVDFLTVDRQGIWRAYEIKVSKSDFYSPAAKSFVGNYNYYVMPEWLYCEVKMDIPKHIGVLVEDVQGTLKSIKQAKKTDLCLPTQELYISLICSLSRNNERRFK